jgi:hypothetical protein
VKKDMWARHFSQTVSTDLCPYFEWWGWKLTKDTKDICAKLPPWNENPINKMKSKFRKNTPFLFSE